VIMDWSYVEARVDKEVLEKIKKDLEKAKVITPSEIASRHGIKVSLAKIILRLMEQEGKIKLVMGDSKQKIYCRTS